MRESVIHVDGLLSVLCAHGVEKSLARGPGVHRVEANYLNGTATVVYDEHLITLAEIKRLVPSAATTAPGRRCRSTSAIRPIPRPMQQRCQ